jgi:hypothetical protein
VNRLTKKIGLVLISSSLVLSGCTLHEEETAERDNGPWGKGSGTGGGSNSGSFSSYHHSYSPGYRQFSNVGGHPGATSFSSYGGGAHGGSSRGGFGASAHGGGS